MDNPLEYIPAKIIGAAQEGTRGWLEGVSADAKGISWSDEVCPHRHDHEQSDEGASDGHHPVSLRPRSRCHIRTIRGTTGRLCVDRGMSTSDL
jgi:hypothetical protein